MDARSGSDVMSDASSAVAVLADAVPLAFAVVHPYTALYASTYPAVLVVFTNNPVTAFVTTLLLTIVAVPNGSTAIPPSVISETVFPYTSVPSVALPLPMDIPFRQL